MPQARHGNQKCGQRWAAHGAIVLSFIVALEFVIMISPFAFVFYSVFNPLLQALDQSPLTRWLKAFFLPHMIVPPNAPLMLIRILGSWFFLGGTAVFLICAAQIYLGRFFRKGPAVKGLYVIIRHPQYVGLAFAALGLAIMWPRFLTLTLFAVMIFLYYLLAKNEEQRMLNQFGDGYRGYLERTGMFLPRRVEKLFSQKPAIALRPGKALAILTGLLVLCVGGGFALRAYTVRHLPLEQVGGVDVITISKDDLASARELLPSALADAAVAEKVRAAQGRPGHRVLAYFTPVNYVMQGLTADTGEKWQLFHRYRTFRMIAQHILHPVAHLTGGHAQHSMMTGQHGAAMHNSPMMKRRIIFLDVSAAHPLRSRFDDFGINTQRTPLCFADVHLHTGDILQVKDTPTGTGWGSVPTPMF